MGIASECSIGTSEKPAVARMMSGKALAMMTMNRKFVRFENSNRERAGGVVVVVRGALRGVDNSLGPLSTKS